MMKYCDRRIILGALLLILCLARHARACDTPVHQYAMENWLPDVYPLVLIHKGPLGDELKKMGEDLEAACNEGRSNVSFLALDVDRTSGTVSSQIRKVQDKFGGGKLPRLVLFGPQSTDPADALWDGPADPATVAAIVDSPARGEIAKRLIEQKHAAVWVMLEGGDKAANDEAARTLEESLAKAPDVLAKAGMLAPVVGEDGTVIGEATSQTANLKFSVLRLAPTDEREQFFVRMLLQLAPPDLRDPKKIAEPILIPVFGRGRALGALPGEHITPDAITEGCAVLAGPCACEIKAQNPGVDMLFAVEWTRAFENEIATAPAIPSLGAVKPLDRTSSTRPAGPAAPAPPSPARGQFPLLASGAGTLLGLLLIAGIAGVLMQRRGRTKPRS